MFLHGKSEADLENNDYAIIKKSFKLKDRTTNWKAIRVIIYIAAIGIGIFIKTRKSGNPFGKRNAGVNNLNYNIDDFNNQKLN